MMVDRYSSVWRIVYYGWRTAIRTILAFPVLTGSAFVGLLASNAVAILVYRSTFRVLPVFVQDTKAWRQSSGYTSRFFGAMFLAGAPIIVVLEFLKPSMQMPLHAGLFSILLYALHPTFVIMLEGAVCATVAALLFQIYVPQETPP